MSLLSYQPFRVVAVVGTVIAMAAALTDNALLFFTNESLSDRIQIYLGFKTPPSSLSDRIKTLTTALNDSMTTIQEIEQDVDNRRALLTRLEQNAETASKVTALHKDEVEAIAQVLRGQIEAEKRNSFWSDQGFAIFYTLLGIGLGMIPAPLLQWWKRRKLKVRRSHKEGVYG